MFSFAELEADLQELNAEISNAATLTAVADEGINRIVDFTLPLLRLTNSQQDELIDEYLAQVRDREREGGTRERQGRRQTERDRQTDRQNANSNFFIFEGL